MQTSKKQFLGGVDIMSSENPNAATFEQAGEAPSVEPCSKAEELAAEAVRLAQAELAKAQEFYKSVRRGAAEKYEQVREQKVGDLIDSAREAAREAVRKRPGLCLVASAAVGFCTGRLLQKILGK
jgi:ElaB/YqjD/DUF883 family membrane-anchored ribosome-binding protein